jgi:hypothetical protein
LGFVRRDSTNATIVSANSSRRATLHAIPVQKLEVHSLTIEMQVLSGLGDVLIAVSLMSYPFA